jgi:hypothetical protein
MKDSDREAEIAQKIMEIIRLKKEVLQLVLPAQTVKHLEVIGNEVKAMLMETLVEGHEKTTQPSGIKKVEID